MNRERKIGTVLTVAGVLTLPVFIGLPLLLVGLVLLVRGTRVDAERWIHVLFRIVLSSLALAIALFVLFSPDGAHSAESGIARSILCASPVCVAILISVAMAVLTVARFQSLSRKARIMGLFFAGLSMVGLCMALVIGFPWQMLGIAAVSTAGWASMKWRRRVRSRRSEALLSPHVGVGTDKARHTEG